MFGICLLKLVVAALLACQANAQSNIAIYAIYHVNAVLLSLQPW